MGRFHSGTARVVRGIRVVGKPFAATKHNIETFADKVSMDVIEQDRAHERAKQKRQADKAKRKAIRKNIANLREMSRAVRNMDIPTPDFSNLKSWVANLPKGTDRFVPMAKPEHMSDENWAALNATLPQQYSLKYYTVLKHEVAEDQSMLLAEGFENLLRTLAGKWRKTIFIGEGGTHGNAVKALIPGESGPKTMLLTGGEFTEMLANIQISMAGLEPVWACDLEGFNNRHEVWKSNEDYSHYTDLTNPLLAASCKE